MHIPGISFDFDGGTLTFIRPINIRIQYKNVRLFSFYLLGIEKDHTILGLLSKISFHFHAQMGPFPALIKTIDT